MIKREAKHMARTNTYTCKTCGTKYEFCLKCQVSRPNYDAENFCSKEHNDIYAILSKHGCNLITADEALAELATYNIDDVKLVENIRAHVDTIKTQATPVKPTEKVVEVKEEVPAQQSNKKTKKKW
jgi:hypothetical protein